MSFGLAVPLLVERDFLALTSAHAMGAFNDNLFRFALITGARRTIAEVPG